MVFVWIDYCVSVVVLCCLLFIVVCVGWILFVWLGFWWVCGFGWCGWYWVCGCWWCGVGFCSLWLIVIVFYWVFGGLGWYVGGYLIFCWFFICVMYWCVVGIGLGVWFGWFIVCYWCVVILIMLCLFWFGCCWWFGLIVLFCLIGIGYVCWWCRMFCRWWLCWVGRCCLVVCCLVGISWKSVFSLVVGMLGFGLVWLFIVCFCDFVVGLVFYCGLLGSCCLYYWLVGVGCGCCFGIGYWLCLVSSYCCGCGLCWLCVCWCLMFMVWGWLCYWCWFGIVCFWCWFRLCYLVCGWGGICFCCLVVLVWCGWNDCFFSVLCYCWCLFIFVFVGWLVVYRWCCLVVCVGCLDWFGSGLVGYFCCVGRCCVGWCWFIMIVLYRLVIRIVFCSVCLYWWSVWSGGVLVLVCLGLFCWFLFICGLVGWLVGFLFCCLELNWDWLDCGVRYVVLYCLGV